MRCYFLKDGHIVAVELLTSLTEGTQIAEARDLFETKGRARGAKGFEVWDSGRLAYRFPEEPDDPKDAA